MRTEATGRTPEVTAPLPTPVVAQQLSLNELCVHATSALRHSAGSARPSWKLRGPIVLNSCGSCEQSPGPWSRVRRGRTVQAFQCILPKSRPTIVAQFRRVPERRFWARREGDQLVCPGLVAGGSSWRPAACHRVCVLCADQSVPDSVTVSDIHAKQLAMDTGFLSRLYRLYLTGTGGVPPTLNVKLPAVSEARGAGT